MTYTKPPKKGDYDVSEPKPPKRPDYNAPEPRPPKKPVYGAPEPKPPKRPDYNAPEPRPPKKPIYPRHQYYTKTIDNIAKAVMLISGIFLFAYFLTLPSQIATQGAQLAPPMPSTAIVVVSLLLIAGVVYFMYTRAIKKMVSIPLSFQ